jgi:hypothetical protein
MLSMKKGGDLKRQMTKMKEDTDEPGMVPISASLPVKIGVHL